MEGKSSKILEFNRMFSIMNNSANKDLSLNLTNSSKKVAIGSALGIPMNQPFQQQKSSGFIQRPFDSKTSQEIKCDDNHESMKLYNNLQKLDDLQPGDIENTWDIILKSNFQKLLAVFGEEIKTTKIKKDILHHFKPILIDKQTIFIDKGEPYEGYYQLCEGILQGHEDHHDETQSHRDDDVLAHDTFINVSQLPFDNPSILLNFGDDTKNSPSNMKLYGASPANVISKISQSNQSGTIRTHSKSDLSETPKNNILENNDDVDLNICNVNVVEDTTGIDHKSHSPLKNNRTSHFKNYQSVNELKEESSIIYDKDQNNLYKSFTFGDKYSEISVNIDKHKLKFTKIEALNPNCDPSKSEQFEEEKDNVDDLDCLITEKNLTDQNILASGKKGIHRKDSQPDSFRCAADYNKASIQEVEELSVIHQTPENTINQFIPKTHTSPSEKIEVSFAGNTAQKNMQNNQMDTEKSKPISMNKSFGSYCDNAIEPIDKNINVIGSENKSIYPSVSITPSANITKFNTPDHKASNDKFNIENNENCNSYKMNIPKSQYSPITVKIDLAKEDNENLEDLLNNRARNVKSTFNKKKPDSSEDSVHNVNFKDNQTSIPVSMANIDKNKHTSTMSRCSNKSFLPFQQLYTNTVRVVKQHKGNDENGFKQFIPETRKVIPELENKQLEKNLTHLDNGENMSIRSLIVNLCEPFDSRYGGKIGSGAIFGGFKSVNENHFSNYHIKAIDKSCVILFYVKEFLASFQILKINKEILNFFSNIPLINNHDVNFKSKLFKLGAIRRLTYTNQIIQENMEIEHIFFIIKGSISVCKNRMVKKDNIARSVHYKFQEVNKDVKLALIDDGNFIAFEGQDPEIIDFSFIVSSSYCEVFQVSIKKLQKEKMFDNFLLALRKYSLVKYKAWLDKYNETVQLINEKEKAITTKPDKEHQQVGQENKKFQLEHDFFTMPKNKTKSYYMNEVIREKELLKDHGLYDPEFFRDKRCQEIMEKNLENGLPKFGSTFYNPLIIKKKIANKKIMEIMEKSNVKKTKIMHSRNQSEVLPVFYKRNNEMVAKGMNKETNEFQDIKNMQDRPDKDQNFKILKDLLNKMNMPSNSCNIVKKIISTKRIVRSDIEDSLKHIGSTYLLSGHARRNNSSKIGETNEELTSKRVFHNSQLNSFDSTEEKERGVYSNKKVHSSYQDKHRLDQEENGQVVDKEASKLNIDHYAYMQDNYHHYQGEKYYPNYLFPDEMITQQISYDYRLLHHSPKDNQLIYDNTMKKYRKRNARYAETRFPGQISKYKIVQDNLNDYTDLIRQSLPVLNTINTKDIKKSQLSQKSKWKKRNLLKNNMSEDLKTNGLDLGVNTGNKDMGPSLKNCIKSPSRCKVYYNRQLTGLKTGKDVKYNHNNQDEEHPFKTYKIKTQKQSKSHEPSQSVNHTGIVSEDFIENYKETQYNTGFDGEQILSGYQNKKYVFSPRQYSNSYTTKIKSDSKLGTWNIPQDSNNSTLLNYISSQNKESSEQNHETSALHNLNSRVKEMLLSDCSESYKNNFRKYRNIKQNIKNKAQEISDSEKSYGLIRPGKQYTSSNKSKLIHNIYRVKSQYLQNDELHKNMSYDQNDLQNLLKMKDDQTLSKIKDIYDSIENTDASLFNCNYNLSPRKDFQQSEVIDLDKKNFNENNRSNSSGSGKGGSDYIVINKRRQMFPEQSNIQNVRRKGGGPEKGAREKICHSSHKQLQSSHNTKSSSGTFGMVNGNLEFYVKNLVESSGNNSKF